LIDSSREKTYLLFDCYVHRSVAVLIGPFVEEVLRVVSNGSACLLRGGEVHDVYFLLRVGELVLDFG